MRAILYLACFVVVFCSCRHQQTKKSQNNSLDTITIEEFACEGNCPVYSLTIYSNGKASFNGKLNVIKEGVHEYQFLNDDAKRLFEYISTINISDFNNEYQSSIADLPETVITYKEKRILIKDMRIIPKDLKSLAIKLKELASSTGFIN